MVRRSSNVPVHCGRVQNWMICASPCCETFRPLTANIRRSAPRRPPPSDDYAASPALGSVSPISSPSKPRAQSRNLPEHPRNRLQGRSWNLVARMLGLASVLLAPDLLLLASVWYQLSLRFSRFDRALASVRRVMVRRSLGPQPGGRRPCPLPALGPLRDRGRPVWRSPRCAAPLDDRREATCPRLHPMEGRRYERSLSAP
jgi:hypothetical protein